MNSLRSPPAASIPELTPFRGQLEDLLAAVTAIRGGGGDAIMVGDHSDERLYTLTSADRLYRVIVEEMGEGAATVSERGVLLYVNHRLSDLLGRSRRDLVGTDVTALVDPADRSQLINRLDTPAGRTSRAELNLAGRQGGRSSSPADRQRSPYRSTMWWRSMMVGRRERNNSLPTGVSLWRTTPWNSWPSTGRPSRPKVMPTPFLVAAQ